MCIHYAYFVCRTKIICFEIALFLLNLLWSGSSVAKETKIIIILSFLIRGICKSFKGYLGTIYNVHIHLCCKEIFRFENGHFLVF